MGVVTCGFVMTMTEVCKANHGIALTIDECCEMNYPLVIGFPFGLIFFIVLMCLLCKHSGALCEQKEQHTTVVYRNREDHQEV